MEDVAGLPHPVSPARPSEWWTFAKYLLLYFALFEERSQPAKLKLQPGKQEKANRQSDIVPVVTVDELRKHNRKDQCWVAVEQKVYDLTEFVDQHPGGRQILLCAAGKDVTVHFNVSHGAKQRARLRKYLVAHLVGNDLPVFPSPSKFHRSVKQRVNDYFTENKIDRKHSPTGLRTHALVLAALTGLTWLQWQPTVIGSNLLFCLVAFAYGLAQVQASVTLVHDGSHGSLTHNPKLWRLMSSAHDFVNGCSSTVWMYQHVISHHAYTNIDHIDVDIDTDDKDFRRFKSRQAYHMFYIVQAIYSPILYVFLATSLRIRDFSRAFGPFWGNILINPMSATELAIFYGGKAFFLLHRVILPLLFAPCSGWKVLLAFLIADFTLSFTFGLISQASHVSTGALITETDTNGKVSQDWMELQIAASVDYAHGSWLTTKFTGALNYQVAHHLFPDVAQCYYPEIAPIVMKTCDEFGIKYNVKESLWEAVGGHLGLLHQMSTPPDTDHY